MRPFDEQGVFGPGTLAIATRAYQDARRTLLRTSPIAGTSPEAQQILAKGIIEGAKKGERDPARLSAYGLLGLIGVSSPSARSRR